MRKTREASDSAGCVRTRAARAALALALVVAGLFGGFWLLTSHQIHASIPPYQGTAIVGNSKLLASVDGRGTIIGLFWPHTGMYQNIYNPRHWVHQRTTPPSTGAFLGVQFADGKVNWLRNALIESQTYLRDSNVLMTRYSLPGSMRITVKDWVLPSADVIIRHVRVSPKPDKGMSIVTYQNFDLGNELAPDRVSYNDGFAVQWRTRPDIAAVVGARVPAQTWHVGEPNSFKEIGRGKFNRKSGGQGDIVTALKWPATDEFTMVYSLAPTREQALDAAREALSVPTARLKQQTDSYWQSWLASGREVAIPDARLNRLYRQSLLVLKLLQDRETGGIAGGARSYWSYCWPRDGVFAAAAFDVAGYPSEAEALYRFLAKVQGSDGTWEARYEVDGSPVSDGRAQQIDAAGYFPWGVWLHVQETTHDGFAREMYRSVEGAANHILKRLDRRTGLPGPSSDYWESSEDLTYYLSNSIVCWAGLTCAADLADRLRRESDAQRFSKGATRIKLGVRKFLWDGKKEAYSRALQTFRGADCAVCWAVYPFAMFPADDARVSASVRRLESRLRTRRGGLVPGEDWKGRDPWIHETSFLLLYHLAGGNRGSADQYFHWILNAATEAHTLPETVSVRTGLPNSTTPLGWAHANFILAAVERWRRGLPEPGIRPPRTTRPSP